VNRRLRVLDVESEQVPERGTELIYEGKKVGRITSALPGLALAFVRTEVPQDAELQFAAKAGCARVRR
jgi:hypothetical protein